MTSPESFDDVSILYPTIQFLEQVNDLFYL